MARARFQREARAIAALNDRHICTIHDVGHEAGVDFIVMERLDGETLAARLSRGAVPYEQALSIAAAIAVALDAAHRAGIVHRDLKPGNVMLTKEGTKLLDFGLAKPGVSDVSSSQSAAGVPATATEVGILAGTLPYMAPEQIGGRNADARSDIFAFGALAFEMLTGRGAFARQTRTEMIAAILHDYPPPVSSAQPLAPPALERTIRKCLAKDPEARWQSARDLADELRWISEDRTSVAGERPPAAGGSRRLAVPVLIAALAGVAAWIFWRPVPDVTPESTISFAISPPEGVTWSDLPPEPMPAVSPDGRKVAFVGEASQGQGLWVRDLGETQARVVPGSMESGGPRTGLFWSSDSSRVGYCIRGVLTIRGFDGRAPVRLDSGCTGGVASWNLAGDILFRRVDGIYSISERGGAPTRLTTLDPSREAVHNYPRWLPDGRRFIYTVVGPNADAAGIYSGSVDRGSRTRILPDVSKTDVVAAPDGTLSLVFVRGRQLIAQQIDIGTLAPVGEPRVLADRMSIGNVAMPSFAASSTLLVYRSGALTRKSSWIWVDRHGQPSGARHTARTGVTNHAALSPDESILTYGATTSEGLSGGLWMVEIPRRVEQPVVEPPPSVNMPAFSRDGRRIAFASIAVGVRELWVMDFPNGTPTRVATSSKLGLIGPEWSADDRALIGTDAFNKIVTVPLVSPDRPVTLVSEGSQPQLSPDGHWLAYTSAISGKPEVYVQGYPDGGDRKRISTDGGVQPRWRGDGTELYYLTADGTVMALAVRTVPEFDVGEPRRLFKHELINRGASSFDRVYQPTRDGQRFLLHVPTEGPVPLTAVRNWLTPAPLR